jgi:hypothetical protein
VWGPEAQSEFWARLDDLAYDIAGLLELLEGETPPSPSPVDDSHPPKPTAYLADVASDVVDEHDALKRDLLRHGYTVLPDPALDQDADLLERPIEELKTLLYARLKADEAKMQASPGQTGSERGLVGFYSRPAKAPNPPHRGPPSRSLEQSIAIEPAHGVVRGT